MRTSGSPENSLTNIVDKHNSVFPWYLMKIISVFYSSKPDLARPYFLTMAHNRWSKWKITAKICTSHPVTPPFPPKKKKKKKLRRRTKKCHKPSRQTFKPKGASLRMTIIENMISPDYVLCYSIYIAECPAVLMDLFWWFCVVKHNEVILFHLGRLLSSFPVSFCQQPHNLTSRVLKSHF